MQSQPPQQQTQQPQGPPIGQTPTLNSLLQSHQSGGNVPQGPHNRYTNNYELSQQQMPQQGVPPQPPQGYGSQQNWSPSQQRPYSPQLGQPVFRNSPHQPPVSLNIILKLLFYQFNLIQFKTHNNLYLSISQTILEGNHPIHLLDKHMGAIHHNSVHQHLLK